MKINNTSHSPGSRSALVFTVLIIVVLVLFAAGLSTYMSRSLEKRTENELAQQVGLLVNTMSSYHTALSDSTEKLTSIFQTYFPGKFSLDPTKIITIKDKRTPLIKSGSKVLNLDTSIVDHFTLHTKATATVFVRSGADFIVIATSLTGEDGSRTTGVN